jgi:hypothetical protein
VSRPDAARGDSAKITTQRRRAPKPPPVIDSLERRVLLSVTLTSDGWTQFSQEAGDRIVYVSSSQGKDGNSGLTSAHPVKTIAKATSLMREGYGDWMLLKNGDTFYDCFSNWTFSGKSADDPMLIGAYGPGERPIVKSGTHYGFAFGGVTVKHVAIDGIFFYASTRDPYSSDFVSPEVGAYGVQSVWPVDDLLIEDCRFRDYQFNLSITGHYSPSGKVRLRRNVVEDAYSTTGRSEGLYMSNIKNVLLEDNIFDHDGWNEEIKGAQATIFNHDAYLSESNTNVVIRGNIFANASSHGLQARSGGKIQGNLFLRDPIGCLFGIGQTVADDGGSQGDVSGNIFLETGTIDGAGRGWGLEIGNIKNGGTTIVRNNIFAQDHQPHYAAIKLTTGGGVVVNTLDAVGVNDLTIENNIIYKWDKGLSIDPALYSGGTGQNSLSNLIIRNNDFQNIYTGQMIISGADADPRQEHFGGNHYYNPGPTNAWFSNANQTVGWDTWYAKLDKTSTRRKMKYFNPERTVETYNLELGGRPTLGSFMTQARLQSRRYWRDAYTSQSLIEYIRQGFRTNGVAPAITATNLSSKNTRPASHAMTFYFNTDVSNSLSASDLQITNIATGQKISAADIDFSYDSYSNIATFSFPGLSGGKLSRGRYTVTFLKKDIFDTRNVSPLADFTRTIRIR